MKIVISFGTHYGSHFLVLDSQHAPLAAGLLANGALYSSDGVVNGADHYKLASDARLSITYARDDQFEELPAAVYEARKNADEQSSKYWAERSRANDLQKQLETAQAQLDELRRATTCTALAEEAEPESEAASDEEE